jgi:hypothetical protein
MSFDIQYPKITSADDAGKIEQIRSYLYQLADQLKFALNSIETGGASSLQPTNKSDQKKATGEDAQATFNSIKALIIKSADIVDEYYEEINQRFSGEYVAQSDFGTYTEHTNQSITTNSTSIESLYTSLQEIITDIDNLEHNLIEVNAHIKSGLLYTNESGVPIYGLEVGQRNIIDGVEVFNKYARFTSNRLSFYDQNDTEVAYISDYKLYITHAQITGTLTLGRYAIDTSNGLAFKWV